VLQLSVLLPAHADKKGFDVARKVDRAWSGYKGEKAEMVFELIDGRGNKVTRKMHGIMRENGRETEQAVWTISWPADLKGMRLLTWSHRTSDDDTWIYLPSIKRVKRISASGRSGSFMGSELSYEDLLNFAWVESYKHKFVRDQKVGPRQTWVVERYPVNRESGYSKLVVWFDTSYLLPLRVDYYDRKGALLKTSMFKGFKKYKGKWRADRVEVVNRQTGKKTNVIFKARTLGGTFSDQQFVPGSLKN
jgi:glycosyltransferase involved in cell wall biosynthesis